MLLDFLWTFFAWFIFMYVICIGVMYFIIKDLMKLKKTKEEEEDTFYDTFSQASFVEDFCDVISGTSSGADRYEEAVLLKRMPYPEDLMEKFLDSCLEDIGFISMENVQWVSGAMAPENEVHTDKKEEEQVRNEALLHVENEVLHATHEALDVEKKMQCVTDEESPKEKICFKKFLKNLFWCCCSSGIKD